MSYLSCPRTAGSSAIARRIVNTASGGSARVLWIGDSILNAFEPYIFQAWPAVMAGWMLRGVNDGAIAQTWTTTRQQSEPGDPSGLLTEKNYSPISAMESVFNGGTVTVGGFSTALESRMASRGDTPQLISTRGGVQYQDQDWLAGQSGISTRVIVYSNTTSAQGKARVGFNNQATGVQLGTTGLLSPPNSAPSWTAYTFAVTPAPTSVQNMDPVLQSHEGLTTVNGSNIVVSAMIITNGQAGLTMLSNSYGGYTVAKAIDPANISVAAWNGTLPLLGGVTDVFITLTQNGTPTTANFNTLVGLIRTALPGIPITFIPTYDTSTSDTNVQQCYAAFQATAGPAAWLNLYRAAGSYAQINGALGLISGDHVHPNDQRASNYFLQVIWGLLEELAGSAISRGRIIGGI